MTYEVRHEDFVPVLQDHVGMGHGGRECDEGGGVCVKVQRVGRRRDHESVAGAVLFSPQIDTPVSTYARMPLGIIREARNSRS